MAKLSPEAGKTGMEAGLVEGWYTAALNQSPGRSHKEEELISKVEYVTSCCLCAASWVREKKWAMQHVVTSGGWQCYTIILNCIMTKKM